MINQKSNKLKIIDYKTIFKTYKPILKLNQLKKLESVYDIIRSESYSIAVDIDDFDGLKSDTIYVICNRLHTKSGRTQAFLKYGGGYYIICHNYNLYYEFIFYKDLMEAIKNKLTIDEIMFVNML